jgi:hypothetical protein
MTATVHSPDAERAVLGCALIEPATLPRIAALPAETFHDIRHRQIYKHIEALAQTEGIRIDTALLSQSILSIKDDVACGGIAYWSALPEACPSATNLDYWLAELAECHARRLAASTADEIKSNLEHVQTAGELEGLLRISAAAIEDCAARLRPTANVVVNAAHWLTIEPPRLDPVINELIEVGDKLAVIGPSKTRKSFLLLQIAIAIAAGISTLGFEITKARRVLVVQLEIQPKHYHRRLRKMAWALGISPEDIADRLQVLNLRGKDIDWPMIERTIRNGKFEVVLFDPLYKLANGDENSAQDMKPILARFDSIAQGCGCAVGYVHHDPKGNTSTRAARDRGAGSNVVGRDFDALIALDVHDAIPDAIVIEFLLRNYPPRPDQTAVWEDGCFRLSDEPAVKQKSRGSSPASEQDKMLPELVKLAAKGLKTRQDFLQLVSGRLGIGERKAKVLLALAVDKNLISGTKRAGNEKGRVFYGLPEHVCRYEQEQQAKEYQPDAVGAVGAICPD